ncbi:T-complex protein 1 subunit theta [Orchesella cincta]|uniref:T-complex protein 1 subunit theta n=1 Tax=Orchesella cincta TaxID=48709 RepID=A0A1D2N1J4_ORCCI|nr:T-complex protein 1 subunit theta [Orchesella cincta]
MAMHVPKAPGFASMLKDGARHFSGLDEAVYRNIRACKEFADSLKTAYGPCGMNKMVVNHIDKLFVTNDAATIMNELDVEHPAAKIMVLAAQMQEQEVGDGTNFVVLFSAALLDAAEDLLKMGLTPTEIVRGYNIAMEKVKEWLPTLVVSEIKDVRDEKQVFDVVRTSVMSKQLGNEDLLARLISKACTSIIPETKVSFNVDNVRVCKILGSSLQRSDVVQGLVFKRLVEGTITRQKDAKLAVFTCPIDVTQTETKGTVLINTAEELMKFSEGEEALLEKRVKAIADSGANVVVAGGKIGDMAMHYFNKYNLMAVRLLSKFDLRRVCKATNASAYPKLETTIAHEDLGIADEVYVDEVGDTPIVVFRIATKESKLSTIVIRGATDNYLDDIERAINDGVNTFKGITRDGKLVPGGGATEIELATKLNKYGDTLKGLEQYSVKKYAAALENFIKIFAENSGLKSNEVLARIIAEHHNGNATIGFNIDDDSSNGLCDVKERGILDLYHAKLWAIEYATTAATTILQVDQIIMAKRAGGPKPKDFRGGDQDDD